MNKKRISKRKGILYFCLAGLVMAAVIVFHHNPLANAGEELVKKIIACFVIADSCGIFAGFYDKITVLPIELYQNRRLIWKLAKNDFKKRYAGSYMGMVWAMVQPVVTVVMYWLVFEKVFGNRTELLAGDLAVPYVLYLTAGLVPWFFFQEGLTNGTSALLEYNYLVKKVVFKISILPIIKVIAAIFIHAFFLCVMLLLAAAYGYFPTVYTIQLFYYSFCTFAFVLAVSYSTCAIVVFFRDLQQIISIALQIGMWATPIMWNITRIQPEELQKLFKLNPMTYIVNGYRSAIFEEEWFFEHFYSTTYFWIVTVLLFVIGAILFKRLKVHFADVL